MPRGHHKHTVFIQRNQKPFAVLVHKISFHDERQQSGFAFHIVIFAFINAHPEHYLEVLASAGTYLGFTQTQASALSLSGKKGAESGGGVAGKNDAQHNRFSRIKRKPFSVWRLTGRVILVYLRLG